jgi:hypothetical protein
MSDAVKIALIVGLCGAVPSFLGMVLGVLTLFRQGRVEAKVDEVKHNTNSLTDKLVSVEKAVSFKEGEAAEKEREK